MSKTFPRVDEVIGLLEDLEKTVRHAAEEEARLNRAVHLKTTALERQLTEDLEAEDIRLELELGKAETRMEEAGGLINSKFRWRQIRIQKAHQAGRQGFLNEISKREGSRRFEAQKGTLEARKHRKAALEETEHAYEQVKRALAEVRAADATQITRARKAFRAYPPLAKLLSAPPAGAPDVRPEPGAGHARLLEELDAEVKNTGARLDRVRKSPSSMLFRFFPVSLLAMLAIVLPGAGALAAFYYGRGGWVYGLAGAAALLALGLIGALYFSGKRKAEPVAREVAVGFEKARLRYEACVAKSAAWHEAEIARIESEYARKTDALSEQLKPGGGPTAQELEAQPLEIDGRAEKAKAKAERIYEEKMARLEPRYREEIEHIRRESEERKRRLRQTVADEKSAMESGQKKERETLVAGWDSSVRAVYETVDAARAAADRQFPAWEPGLWKDWTLPKEFSCDVKFGHMDIDVEKLAGAIPQDARLALPGPPRFSVPLVLSVPSRGSILIETEGARSQAAIGALNNIILRLLSVSPPGKLSFTILDPVGLGENFAGIMHLADYEEHLINSRIWTQTDQIEARLAELNEHMEKVIQMYLRNEFETITQYNEQAGNISEKYHYLVVADFPAGFSDLAGKRLQSICASGARCGVYTLIHWDRRHRLPQEFVPEELREKSVWVRLEKSRARVTEKFTEGAELALGAPPDPEFAIEFIQRVGRESIDSLRVEVPFEHVIPQSEDEFWSRDTVTELKVPIGRTGATKLQQLAIGKGTRQHGLIAGKTGSGKSTLFHVMITNMALWFSPDEVEFYLVDFKKGVEFKCYATRMLPHARVVAIESDREFGLSVLERVDQELKRRGDMFRELGVQDIAGYKRAGGKEPVPRCLLIIDEFQEFFVEDDRVSQNAAVLLDRIVRQGRAFGIHALLGSQTLGGAFTLARTTLGQMVIRIALQCNEADAYLIMDDSNPAPRLLTRPGEGIYNDSAGMLEGNSPFQVVWLPDDERDRYLDRAVALAERSGKNWPRPIVFEGNAPADVRENMLLQKVLEADAVEAAVPAKAWLGAPNSIKGPTEIAFHRQSGNNLLIVGQREEAALVMLELSLVALAAQIPLGAARFVLFDGSAPESPQREVVDRLERLVPHGITVGRGHDAGKVMCEVAAEMRSRGEDQGGGTTASRAPATFVFVHGVQKFKHLRFEEDFSFSMDDSAAAANPGTEFNSLICEGASLGFHVIAFCDTYNNLSRFLSRKALTEFEMRVLFQMSANDSASLIDSPKAGTLGMHRALFYNEQEGYLETFRPYALPGEDWMESAARNLARLHGVEAAEAVE